MRQEGGAGLFRGNGVQMLRVFPYGGIQFACYESFKKLLNASWETKTAHWQKFVAGSMGGVCGVAATFPLDTMRARLAFHTKAGMTFKFLFT